MDTDSLFLRRQVYSGHDIASVKCGYSLIFNLHNKTKNAKMHCMVVFSKGYLARKWLRIVLEILPDISLMNI